MDIHREGKFRVGTDPRGRLLLGIESSRLAACVAEAKRRQAYGVFGNPGFGFKQDNLDFLASLPQIQYVWFWDVTLKSVDGLYALPRLKYFGVHPKRPPIDFGRLRTLEQAVWFYNAKDPGLATLKRLRTLSVWRYNPKHRGFGGLELPTQLEDLEFTWGNPTTLAALPTFPRLTRLKISRFPNLASLAELPRVAPNVEHLVVTGCGRVTDGAEVVARLPKLRHAYVRDKVLVTR